MGRSVTGLARYLLHLLTRLRAAPASGVTILAYHLVEAGTNGAVDLPLSTFRRQLKELSELGNTVTLTAAAGLLTDVEVPTPRRVVLSFDDAFLNFYDTIWPALSELDLPATLYVPVRFLEGRESSPLAGARDLPPMTWSRLREVAASGLVTIGSHGLSHSDLRRLTRSRLQAELRDSRRVLEDRLGQPVSSFSYPRALWNRAVVEETRNWYQTAVAAGGRTNRSGSCQLHLLSRVPIRRDMPESLDPVLRADIWLEEWAASKLRPLTRTAAS